MRSILPKALLALVIIAMVMFLTEASLRFSSMSFVGGREYTSPYNIYRSNNDYLHGSTECNDYEVLDRKSVV